MNFRYKMSEYWRFYEQSKLILTISYHTNLFFNEE